MLIQNVPLDELLKSLLTILSCQDVVNHVLRDVTLLDVDSLHSGIVHGQLSRYSVKLSWILSIVPLKVNKRADLAESTSLASLTMDVCPQSLTFFGVPSGLKHFDKLAVFLSLGDSVFQAILNSLGSGILIKAFGHLSITTNLSEVVTVLRRLINYLEVLLMMECLQKAFETLLELLSLGNKVGFTGKLDHRDFAGLIVSQYSDKALLSRPTNPFLSISETLLTQEVLTSFDVSFHLL